MEDKVLNITIMVAIVISITALGGAIYKILTPTPNIPLNEMRCKNFAWEKTSKYGYILTCEQ